ncbi:hypothetical protein EV646_116127 [Kribbella antiqua]|uniref:Uncharacterized protein n=1 Tax=Kribbella antiqua TaxID=2512217 RepID=A0A4R2IAE9_9ACTN|nr:hypothetical protein EV646_116127 [Kribbella antiqua]
MLRQLCYRFQLMRIRAVNPLIVVRDQVEWLHIVSLPLVDEKRVKVE